MSSSDDDRIRSIALSFFRDITRPGIGIGNAIRAQDLVVALITSAILFVWTGFIGIVSGIAGAASLAVTGVTDFVVEFITRATGVVIEPLRFSIEVSGVSVDAAGLFGIIVAVIIVALAAFLVSTVIDVVREGF